MRPFWYVVEELKNIKTAKSYRFSIHDIWIVVFRDSNNRPVAMEDKCLHKCTRLSGGRVSDGIIECPYHGWRYDSSGALVAIPSDDGKNKLIGSKFLRKFFTKESQDYLYVWLGVEAPTSTPFKIPFYQHKGWRSIRLKNNFENTLGNCADNFLDIPHTSFVHPGLFRNRKRQKFGATVSRREGEVHVDYHLETDNFGWFTKFLNRRGEKIFHTDHFYPPNITCVEYRFPGDKRFFIVSQLVEWQAHKTVVFTDLTFDYGIWNLFAQPIVKAVAQKIIRQDVRILKDHGDSIKKYGQDYMNTSTDLIHIYIESILRKIGSGSDPRSLPNKSTEIEFWV